jgi:hypothetical protein
MTKGMGVACFGLFAKNKKHSRTVSLFALVSVLAFSTILAPLFYVEQAAATASSELVLYDARTDHRKVTDEKKTVTITAYIAGPESSTGTFPDLEADDISVFGESTLEGNYGFMIDWVRPVGVEEDPHYGMYEVRARGRPHYLGSSPYNYDITFCALLADEKEAHCATKNFNTGSSSNPSGETANFSTTESDVVKLGYMDPETEKDDAEKTCRTESGIIGVFLCPITDLLGEGVTTLYESVVEKWLNIEPELFSHSAGDTGELTFEAWETARDLANLLLVVLLIAVIISQVTGYGVSNYGVKKGLPKILIGGALINLSYYLCQASIDLSNILGNGIAGYLESAAEDFNFANAGFWGNQFTGGLLLILSGVVGFLLINALNPALFIVLLGGLLSAILAVFILAITLGVRKAAAIIVVIVSPVAFICYAIPGLKNIYDRWLKLFKIILITYPLASLVVYGGALGGKILIISGGGESFFGALAAMAVTVVPFFMLPKIISQSLGGLSMITTKLQNNISNRASRAYNNSGIKRYVTNESQRKRLGALAGVKFDKNGNAKRTLGSKIMPFSAQRSEFMRQAVNMQAANAEHRLLKSDPDYFGDRQLSQKIAGIGKDLDAMNLTPTQLADQFDSLTGAMASAADDIELTNNQAMIAALTSRLVRSKDGRARLEAALSSPTLNGTPVPNGNAAARTIEAMSMGVSARDYSTIDHSNPYLSNYLRSVRENGFSGSGTYDNFKMTESMLQRMNTEDWGKLGADTCSRMMNDALSSPNSSAAAAFNHFMEEVADNVPRGGEAAAEVQNTSSDTHIGEATDYISRRNNDINSSAASLLAMGTSSGDITGSYNDDFSFLQRAFMDASQHGDLIGMEAAHKALMDRATQEESTLIGSAAEQFMLKFNSQMDEMYKTLVSPDYSSNFRKLGSSDGRSMDEIRSATSQQVALFRARAQGKNG